MTSLLCYIIHHDWLFFFPFNNSPLQESQNKKQKQFSYLPFQNHSQKINYHQKSQISECLYLIEPQIK